MTVKIRLMMGQTTYAQALCAVSACLRFALVYRNQFLQRLDGGRMVSAVEYAVTAPSDPLLDIFRRIVDQHLVRAAEILLELFRYDMHREFRPKYSRYPFPLLLLESLVARCTCQEDGFEVAGRFPKCHAAFDKLQFGKEALVGVDHLP